MWLHILQSNNNFSKENENTHIIRDLSNFLSTKKEISIMIVDIVEPH